MRGAAIWGGLALATLSPFRRAIANPVFINDPFQLGVASGDPTADGFVIWTRLVPDIFDPQALPPEAIEVRWEVAADAGMKKIVQRGTALAHPELAHSVHVDLRGLEPGRDYFYRFMSGAAVSRTGHTKTWPTPRLAGVDRVRFAVASCQHYGQGYFTAYRDMIAQNPDFILHLGDYIYEVDGGTMVRRTPVALAHSLNDYRLLHAVCKTDPDLQNAHAHCPWMMMWDDHEVSNDYSRTGSERYQDPVEFAAVRAAAYQAYYEHMPVRASAMPDADHKARMFQSVNYGDLMEMVVLDLRQFRDPIACQTDQHGGRVIDLTQCEEARDPKRSMLGAAQEKWLRDSTFGKVPMRWNVIAQTLMLASLDQVNGSGHGYYSDGWGGYQPARKRILDLVQERNLKNAVSLGGDIHSFFVSDVRENDDDPKSPLVLSEFVGTSITTESTIGPLFKAVVPKNPHIKYWDDTKRGYMLFNVDRNAFRADMRAVENVRVRESTVSTQKSFVLENGKPGLQTA